MDVLNFTYSISW